MADEGMNIPFNISGNADEALTSINELVKLLTQSLVKLSAQSKETQGGTKEVKKGAKETTRAVKAETRAMKQARLELQRYKNARKAATRAAKDLNTQAERTGLALKDETRALRQATTIIRKRAIEERKLELLQRKGFDSTGRRIGQYKVEALAIDAVNKRLFKKALAEATARKAMERGIATAKERALIEGRTAAATDRTAAATNRAANATRRYRGEVAKASHQGNRAAFIFRRLFGVLAAFTAARFAITGFFAGVREAIEFNKNIQQAQLGIASLFLAVGQVRNEMGEVVSGAEGLAVAMKESKRQTELLRKDALSTAATFDELLQTFQIGLAPGLAAGLNPDEIRNLAIRISQAASAIGLPMNQLSEEIRSILAGTIQQRTTRIAAALGIRNEDIRNAKRAGQLFKFLSDKFDAFGVAGQKAMDQFFGIVTRVQDALKQLLGAAGLGFFEQLQTLLRETFELLTDSDSFVIQPDPQAIAILEKIFDGFEGAVRNVRDLTKALSGEDLTAVASAIGTIIEVGSALLLGFVQGIIEAFGIIKQLADPILNVFKAVGASIPGEEIREVVAALTQVITLMFLWKTIATAIGVIQRKNLLSSGNLLGFLLTAAILLDKFLAKLVGVENLNFKDAFSILKLSFLNVVDELIARTTLLFAKALDLVINFISDPLLTLQKLTLDAAQTILTALSFVSDAANDALNEVYKKQGENQKKFNDLSKDNATAAQAQLDAIIAANDSKMAALFARIKAEDDERKKGAKADDDRNRKEADFNGLIAIGLQTLKAEASVINKIADNLEEAQKSAAFKSAFGFNISSETKAEVNAFNTAFAKIREDTKKINGQITQFEDGLAGVRANLLAVVDGSERQKELLAQEKAAVEAIAVLTAAKESLGNQVIQTTRINLTLLREEALVHSRIARTIAEEELAATLAVQEARKQGATSAEIELIQIHKRLVALGNEKQLILARSQADIAIRQKDLAFGQMTAEQRAVAEETIRELYAKQGLELDQINAKMEELKLKAIAVGDEVEDGLVGGMARGFAQFTIQFQSQFQAGVDIARGATESLANFISTAISDAFDPNSDTTLKQRFGQFLQEISNMIIQTLVRLAIAKAILGIVGGPGVASAAGTAAGAAEGGLMKAYASNMSHWGKYAQGLAKGGQPRPKGLHPSDTIPIWAAKGEYMQPADSVRMYGLVAMNAIKDKLVDPMALNSLVNSKRSSRGSRRRSMGYAEGGAITEVVSSTKADQVEDQNVGVDRDTPIAALIANDNTMDKILAGGKGAMTRWLEENGYRPHGM
jgi:hypothetical protein